MRQLSKIGLLSLVLVAAVGAWAQAGGIYGQVIQPPPPTGTGGPAAFATVRVCPSTGLGVPCSPTSNLFSDTALSVPVPNPFTTDQFGNYSFYLLPGYYLVQIGATPTITYIYQATSVGIGTVTSIGLSLPASVFSVSGSPVTSSGTLTGTFISQSANQVFGNCTNSSAVPTFCSLTANMIPGTLNATTIDNLTIPATFTLNATLAAAVTVPTVSLSDNSNNAASTAWVKGQGYLAGSGSANQLVVWTGSTAVGSSVFTDTLVADSAAGATSNTSEKFFWQYRPSVCSNTSCKAADLELVWQAATNLPSATMWGAFAKAVISENTAGTQNLAAIHGVEAQGVNNGGTSGVLNVTEVAGVYAYGSTGGNAGTSSTTRQAALRAVTDNTGTGLTLPDNRAVDVLSGGSGVGDTITTDYGIYVRTPQTSSNLTTHYGIYVDDQTTGVSGAAVGVNIVKDVLKFGSVTFANLPTGSNAPNGSTIYCSDCNNACSAGSSTGKTCFRENSAWVGEVNNPLAPSIQIASLTTNTGTAIGASATTWITKAITMPASGGPFRVLVSYAMMFTATASGSATCWVEDGTNQFATNNALTNTAGGGNHSMGCAGASVSPQTYANGAAITFTGRGYTDSSGGITVASGANGSTQASYLSLAVLSSN